MKVVTRYRTAPCICVVSVLCIIVALVLCTRHDIATLAGPTCWQMLSSDASHTEVMRFCKASHLRQVARQLAKASHSSTTHEKVQSSPEQVRTDTVCTTFRDVSSEKDETQIPFPDIISTCGGEKPRLASRVHVSSTRNTSPTTSNTAVPNVVHYVWFRPPKQHDMTFLSYLSIRSVDKFLKPQYIFIHGDGAPTGQWWDKAIGEIPNIYLVNRSKPATINGKIPHFLEHSSDIARMEILLDYGGIYLDWDSLALRSFEPLLEHDLTMGRHTPIAIANGIILAKRASAFIRIWLETYHTFQVKEWGEHSTAMAHKLEQLFPHLVHVEETSLMRPNWHPKEVKQLYHGHYPWEKNYAIHVWTRQGHVPPQNSAEVKKLNSTLGDVMRHILYSD